MSQDDEKAPASAAGDGALMAVDLPADRAATWRVLGIEPEEAERHHCWLAPSVGSALDRLRAIETAARTYRDAVLKKRELESTAKVMGAALSSNDPDYRAAMYAVEEAKIDKTTAGEALFDLLKEV